MPIPSSVLKLHNKNEDAWTTINGKVYNITPSYHPGGEKELMTVAGRDGTKLFYFMLDACLVGFLVSKSLAHNGLDGIFYTLRGLDLQAAIDIRTELLALQRCSQPE